MMRLLCVLMLLVTVAGLAGCEALGLAADTIAPPKTKAIYNLQDRLTLVLVDDPNNHLGNDALTDQIAAMIEFELKQNEVVSRFVPLRDLHALEHQRGKSFVMMPLQDVGRALNAEQVLHVHIEQVDVDSGPGLLQPEAFVRLKVLDVATGRRLFPSDTHAASGASAGYELHIRMRQRIRPVENAGDRIVLFSRFADHIGRDIARVFYDHLQNQPGQLGKELREAR